MAELRSPGLRRRRPGDVVQPTPEIPGRRADSPGPRPPPCDAPEEEGARTSSTFWVSRALVIRSLGLIYVCIFLSTEAEAALLIGHQGLTPAVRQIKQLRRAAGSRGVWATFLKKPSLLHILPASWFEGSDLGFTVVCRGGLLLSVLLFLGVSENMLLVLGAWCAYNSIREVGGAWYGFAWEPQLAETALYIALLLCPLLRRKGGPIGSTLRMPLHHHVARCGMAWLAFRVMLAAGLLKLRARDPCWNDYTCFKYHYENMPMPNPLSWFAHHVPLEIHSWVQFVSIQIVEVCMPFGFLFCALEWAVPVSAVCRWLRRSAAVSCILLMVGIQSTGNYSFLNVTTCLPCVACLDDALLAPLMPYVVGRPKNQARVGRFVDAVRTLRICAIAVFLLLVSLPGASWLWSANQQFAGVPPQAVALWRDYGEPFNLGSLYSSGRFAHITRERFEVVLWALRCTEGRCSWIELNIPCKPGSLDRKPCVTAPYHRRLAWQFWFVGLGHDDAWLVAFVERLLSGDSRAAEAVEGGRAVLPKPPTAVQARLYRYRFSSFGGQPVGKPGGHQAAAEVSTGIPALPEDEGMGLWWQRSFERQLIPTTKGQSPAEWSA